MTNQLKTARCIDRPGTIQGYAGSCDRCIRKDIPDSKKQAWQFPPNPNTDGTCPSFTTSFVTTQK